MSRRVSINTSPIMSIDPRLCLHHSFHYCILPSLDYFFIHIAECSVVWFSLCWRKGS
jgi:hypothetical protein